MLKAARQWHAAVLSEDRPTHPRTEKRAIRAHNEMEVALD
jgi:hypothetical protein